MARRRSKTSATGGNMDSLLDALTNVVGILVIVLVAVQLSSQDAARQIVEEYEKKISPEERAKAEEHAEEVVKDLKRVEKLIQREKKLQAGDPEKELQELKDELKKLEGLAKKEAAAAEKKRQEAEAKKAEVMEQIDGLHKQLAELEEKSDKVEVQRAALMTELKETRAPKPPPVKEVRLPTPKPSFMFVKNSKGEPELKNLQPLYVLCRGDRIIPFPIKGLSWKENPNLERWFERTLKSLKIAADKDGWLIPNPALYQSYEEMADAIVKESEEKPLNLRGFDDFEISIKRAGANLNLVLIPKENAGEKINRAATKTSDFNKLLFALATDKNPYFYIRYLVEPDAFETYLEVRNFTDSWTMPGNALVQGWAAGWEPIPSNTFKREYFAGVRAGEKPPPAPPSTTPPQKKPPAVLSNDLD
jgi:chemotaxis protein histidine kinase CheA